MSDRYLVIDSRVIEKKENADISEYHDLVASFRASIVPRTSATSTPAPFFARETGRASSMRHRIRRSGIWSDAGPHPIREKTRQTPPLVSVFGISVTLNFPISFSYQ